jgi:hypothetical protein
MRIEDLAVEVRDSDLKKVGALSGADLVGAEFILKFNDVGSWSVQLHSTSAMATLLRTPGYGLVVSGPNGVLLSGPTTYAELQQSQDDPDGTWMVRGVDDSVILAERLVYPDPVDDDVTSQQFAYDTRNDVAETVLKEYVDANLVSGPASRQVAGLTVEADLGRGSTVYGDARFQQIQEFFHDLAQTGGVGYKIEQVGTGLQFQVYEPVDRSALIRLDIENGRLTTSNYSYTAPTLTRAIVGGAGEAEERLFYEGTSATSLTAETEWGRRIEKFVDARNVQENAEFVQHASEALVDNGKTKVSLTVTPTDDGSMLFGDEWGLGDTLTVVAGSIVTTAVVYTVALSVQVDGVYIAAEVGKPLAADFEQKLAEQTVQQTKRISEIERNTTGYGVVTPFPGVEGGTIGGTQPTFSGPVFTATYTRFGDMIHFSYSVDFDNILTFGTGQYYMTLPYNSRRPTTFAGGSLFDDSSGKIYSILGQVDAGSNQMKLYYIQSNGQTDTFEHNKPITLTVDDRFDITGVYELEY